MLGLSSLFVRSFSKHDLREVQEGDPKYLAPEVLASYNNITCAADIFSLGMTVLELATDLELPRGGDAWHQLRNGLLPAQITSSLSKELLEIIRLMIEPDHLKRATVDQLLDATSVQAVMRERKRKYALASMLAHIKRVFQQLNRMALTIWYFFMRPLNMAKAFAAKLYNALPGLKRGSVVPLNGRRFSENGGDLNRDDNEQKLHHTSTPKRDNGSNVPIIMMQVDEEDAPSKWTE